LAEATAPSVVLFLGDVYKYTYLLTYLLTYGYGYIEDKSYPVSLAFA